MFLIQLHFFILKKREIINTKNIIVDIGCRMPVGMQIKSYLQCKSIELDQVG